MPVITQFPFSAVDTGLTSVETVNALNAADKLNRKKPAATVETVDAAKLAVLSGTIEVGELIQTVEYSSGSASGGRTYILNQSGSRPDEDEGYIIHVDTDKWLEDVNFTIARLEDFGATNLTQSKFDLISTGRTRIKSEANINLSEQIIISGTGLTIDLSTFTVTSSLTTGVAIVISGDANTLLINYDGQDNPVTPIQITGTGNTVKGVIRNVQAQAGMTNTHIACVDDRGASNSEIDVLCMDISNDGYTDNGSYPHCVSLQNNSYNAEVTVKGINVVSGIITSVCKIPLIKSLIIDGAADNGLYVLENSEGVRANYVRYKGSEESFVDKGLNTVVDKLDIVDIKNPIGLQNSTNCTINEINLIYDNLTSVKSSRSALIQTRSLNTLTSGLRINKVNGWSYGNRIFGFDNGECKDWTVQGVNITHVYHNASQAKSILSHGGDNTGYFNVLNCNFKVVDELGTLTGSDQFTFSMPTEMTKPSKWHYNTLDVDGVFQIRVNNIGQEIVSIKGDSFMETTFGPRIRESTYVDYANKVVWGTAAPTVGSWKRGDRVYALNATAGVQSGWICVTAGTPGTWKAFANIEA